MNLHSYNYRFSRGNGKFNKKIQGVRFRDKGYIPLSTPQNFFEYEVLQLVAGECNIADYFIVYCPLPSSIKIDKIKTTGNFISLI